MYNRTFQVLSATFPAQKMPFCAFCRSALSADRSRTESCAILRLEQIGIIRRLLSGMVWSCLYRSAVIFRRSIQIIPYNSKRSNAAQCIVFCPMYCLLMPNVLFKASGNRYMPFCDGIRPFCPIRIGAAYFGTTSLCSIPVHRLNIPNNIHSTQDNIPNNIHSTQDNIHDNIPKNARYISINLHIYLHTAKVCTGSAQSSSSRLELNAYNP